MPVEVGVNGSFIHRDVVLRAFAELFLKGYGIDKPVIEPDRLVHWQAQMQLLKERAGLNPSQLGAAPTFVFGGYFYNFSTPPPGAAQIAAALELGRGLGARQFLVPTVPAGADARALEAAGFLPLPCFEMATFNAPRGIEEGLRANAGGARFRELRRMTRRAAETHSTRFVGAADLDAEPALVPEIARLHELNLVQHGFDVNFFPAAALDFLRASALRDNLLVLLRVERETGAAVQTMICLVAEDTRELFALAQGIDHERVGREINLYAASFCELYEYGFARGVRVFHLGRGGAQNKRLIGADEFHLLNHWIRSDEAGFEAEIGRMAAAMRPLLATSAGVVSEPR